MLTYTDDAVEIIQSSVQRLFEVNEANAFLSIITNKDTMKALKLNDLAYPCLSMNCISLVNAGIAYAL